MKGKSYASYCDCIFLDDAYSWLQESDIGILRLCNSDSWRGRRVQIK